MNLWPSRSANWIDLGHELPFDLGAMRVIPAERVVIVDHRRRELQPRVMQVLLALAKARPNVVSRDDLFELCWHGRVVGDAALNRCILALRHLTQEISPKPFTIETIPRVGHRLVERCTTDEQDSGTVLAGRTRPDILLAVLIIGALMVAGLVAWHSHGKAPGVVSVAVKPASAMPESDELARDLTAKLAMFNGVNEETPRLFERMDGEKPDLQFDIDASRDGSEVTSNLVLLDERGELLWSTNFRQARTRFSDLKQQLAFTAAKVLSCALETIGKEKPRLDRQIIKLYLNGCSAYADLTETNIFDIERTFRRVVDAAPGFQPGWRKLLLAESATLDDYFDPTSADLARARQTLLAARKINPAMPEIHILEAEIVPPTAMTDRMRFVEMAVREAPSDGNIAMIHALYLLKVGRLKDAAAEATRSVRNDPLSPVNRETAVIALGSDGRTAEAEQQLREAEALWPGASTLRTARFTFFLRFDDPKEAIRLRDSGLPMPSMSPFVASFLRARAKPEPANVELALRDARALYARTPLAISHLSQTLGAFHREDELFQILLNWQYPDKVDQVTDTLFRPALRNFHHDPRFMLIAANLGLLQYWQSTGKWPDFCFDSDLPYDCKAEAATIARGAA